MVWPFLQIKCTELIRVTKIALIGITHLRELWNSVKIRLWCYLSWMPVTSLVTAKGCHFKFPENYQDPITTSSNWYISITRFKKNAQQIGKEKQGPSTIRDLFSKNSVSFPSRILENRFKHDENYCMFISSYKSFNHLDKSVFLHHQT